MDFYTYQYLRVDGSPYYVGKGKAKRAWQSITGHRPPRDRSRVGVQYWPDEATAFAYERYLIDFWGRKDLGTGCLRNLTDGGDGASNPSAETRKRRGDACRGVKNHNYGKKFPADVRRKLSEARMGIYPSAETRLRKSEAVQGEKNPNFGNHKLVGINNPMFGKTRLDLAEWNRRNLKGVPRPRSPKNTGET